MSLISQARFLVKCVKPLSRATSDGIIGELFEYMYMNSDKIARTLTGTLEAVRAPGSNPQHPACQHASISAVEGEALGTGVVVGSSVLNFEYNDRRKIK